MRTASVFSLSRKRLTPPVGLANANPDIFREPKAKKTLLTAAAILFLLSALAYVTEAGRPRAVFGISFFTAHEDVHGFGIPKGSLIIVRDRADLKAGDAAVYARDKCTFSVQEITGVWSGETGRSPTGRADAGPTGFAAKKIIKVIPKAGAAVDFINANFYAAYLIMGVCALLYLMKREQRGTEAQRDALKLTQRESACDAETDVLQSLAEEKAGKARYHIFY